MVRPPNLFIIGAPRCGTTSLYSAFKQHPQIYTSVLKEPHFYAQDMPIQPHTVTSVDEYSHLFYCAKDEKYVAEASVWYLYSKSAASLISKEHPEARIVIMLRNPVEMIVSLYNLYLRTGNETQTDPRLALLRNNEEVHKHSYFPFGLYYKRLIKLYDTLETWFSYFKREQINILFYEEFYHHPNKSFTQLCNWLNIDDDADISFDPVEARKRVKFKAMRQLRHLPTSIKEKINPAASKLHAQKKHKTISEDVMEILRRESTERSRNLPAIIGRDLPLSWT
ncbi:sulfotransferase family protein [Agarilytica rhodophyticola]|uniref:sulfotransferase family protein n=1 Tax=Agarilytica rhodophyticola TaxID=1737490 RepID=UPI000B34495E|nr:sulfotransferase [Agarilytica rhodophyticola]